MRAHYLQHVPFEGLGSIEDWLLEHNYIITATRLYADEQLPNVDNIDLLIILGGPMSVNDEQMYPWLKQEKAFIHNAIAQNIPILGICLGAQLIASACGARVYPQEQKEIGWWPIQKSETSADGCFGFPEEMVVFHWHGETFETVPGSIVLAESTACSNQAFQLGENVLGLQFHLETTPTSLQQLCENCRDEIKDGAYVQTEAEMAAIPEDHYRMINNLMKEILGFLTSQKETGEFSLTKKG